MELKKQSLSHGDAWILVPRPWHCWHLELDHSLRWAVLCALGCWTASLASTHHMQLEYLCPHSGQPKMPQTLPKCPLRVRLAPRWEPDLRCGRPRVWPLGPCQFSQLYTWHSINCVRKHWKIVSASQLCPRQEECKFWQTSKPVSA